MRVVGWVRVLIVDCLVLFVIFFQHGMTDWEWDSPSSEATVTRERRLVAAVDTMREASSLRARAPTTETQAR